MNQPNANIIEEVNPETVGDIVKRNISEVKSLLQDDSPDLDKGSALLAENKALLSHGGFSTEITPEILEDVAKKVAEAPKINAQDQQIEIGKHEFLLLIQNATGLDFSNGEAKFSMFDIYNAVVSMAEPGAMDAVMDKMKQAIDDIKSKDPSATPEKQIEAVIHAGKDAVKKMEQEKAPAVSENNDKDKGLGGVNGTAITYEVSKEPDLAVADVAIKPAIQDGTSLITGSFTNNVFAEGVMVDAKIDPSALAANQPDFSFPNQEQEVKAPLISNGLN